MRKWRFNLVRPTMGRHQYARMATMGIRHTPARRTATTALIILLGACSLARVRGSTVSTGVADSMAVAGFMAEGQRSMVVVDSGLIMDSAAARLCAEAVDSAVSPQRAVGAGSVAGVVFTAVVHPTAEAAGNCYKIFLSHLSGWQPTLPAVFFSPRQQSVILTRFDDGRDAKGQDAISEATQSGWDRNHPVILPRNAIREIGVPGFPH
jgi:hypothetical protein